MKKSLLIGLTAVALGSMTACSNILEEEGTISAKTGKLIIGLETDDAVNIVTKTENKETVIFTDEQKQGITITGTAGSDVMKPENFSVPTTVGTHTVPKGTYYFSATNGTMSDDFEWDKPYFLGTCTTTVAANGVAAEANIVCDLTNSMITIVKESFENLASKGITVTDLFVVNQSGNIEKETQITATKQTFYNSSTLTSLKEDYLYANANLTNVKVIIDGYVTADNTKTFRGVADIKSGTVIGADNKYNVTFNLNESQGSLSLSIEVNGEVTPIDIVVPVNPYE